MHLTSVFDCGDMLESARGRTRRLRTVLLRVAGTVERGCGCAANGAAESGVRRYIAGLRIRLLRANRVVYRETAVGPVGSQSTLSTKTGGQGGIVY